VKFCTKYNLKICCYEKREDEYYLGNSFHVARFDKIFNILLDSGHVNWVKDTEMLTGMKICPLCDSVVAKRDPRYINKTY
jgi:hypothetical protein